MIQPATWTEPPTVPDIEMLESCIVCLSMKLSGFQDDTVAVLHKAKQDNGTFACGHMLGWHIALTNMRPFMALTVGRARRPDDTMRVPSN